MSSPVDDLVSQVRVRRRELRFTQAELAAACGVSQGHISKILGLRTPPGPDVEKRLRSWLSMRSDATDPVEVARSMSAIAGGIEQRCTELAVLANRLRVLGEGGGS